MIFFNDLWRLSFLKLRVRRKRLWFTVIGVGLGVGLVALATTLIYNGKNLALKKSTERLFDLTIIQVRVGSEYGLSTMPMSMTMRGAGDNAATPPRLTIADVDKIKTILPQAQNVSPEIELWNNLIAPDQKLAVGSDGEILPLMSPIEYWKNGAEITDITLDMLRGIDEEIFNSRTQVAPATVAPTEIPIIISPITIMNTIGRGQGLNMSIFMKPEDYAAYLGQKLSFVFQPGYVGKDKPANLKTQEQTFVIVGISPDGSYIPLKHAAAIEQWWYDETMRNIPDDWRNEARLDHKPGEYNALNVVAPSLDEVHESAGLLEASGYGTYSYNNIATEIADAFRFMYYGVITAGSVVILIVLFIVMNTIGKMVSDSTKEIGIFKTLGATKSDIRKIFMTQTLIISGVGSAVGVVLGYMGAPLAVYLFLSFISRLNPGMDENFMKSSEVGDVASNFFGLPLLQLLVLWAATALICTLVSFGRAQRAAKLNPVAALKDEA